MFDTKLRINPEPFFKKISAITDIKILAEILVCINCHPFAKTATLKLKKVKKFLIQNEIFYDLDQLIMICN